MNLLEEKIKCEEREIMEMFHWIWLDATEYQRNNDNVRQALQTMDVIGKILTDCKTFEQFRKSLSISDRIILIVSGRFREEILPQCHLQRNISSTDVFCSNKEKHDLWTKDFSKVKLF